MKIVNEVFESHGTWFVQSVGTSGSFPTFDGRPQFRLGYAMALVGAESFEGKANRWYCNFNAVNLASYLEFQQRGPRSKAMEGQDPEEVVAKEWLATQAILRMCMHGELPFVDGGDLDLSQLQKAIESARN